MGRHVLVDILVRLDPDVSTGSKSPSDSFVIRMLDFAVRLSHIPTISCVLSSS